MPLARGQSTSFSHPVYSVPYSPYKHAASARHPTKIRAAKSAPAVIASKPVGYPYGGAPAVIQPMRGSERVSFGYPVALGTDEMLRSYSGSPCAYPDLYPGAYYPNPSLLSVSRSMSRDSCNPMLSCPSTIYPSVSQDASFPAMSTAFVGNDLQRTTVAFEPFSNPYATVIPVPFQSSLNREPVGSLGQPKYSFPYDCEGRKEVITSPVLSGNAGVDMKPINSEVVELVHTSSSAVALVTPNTDGGAMSPLRPDKEGGVEASKV